MRLVPIDNESFLDPDASREYLRSWKERVDQVAVQSRSMAEQLEKLRIKAQDHNGLAEVTIDSSGVLVDLKLTARTRREEPEVVARAMMTALQAARTKAAERTHEIAVQTMGPDSLSARTIADRMRQLLERPDAAPEQRG